MQYERGRGVSKCNWLEILQLLINIRPASRSWCSLYNLRHVFVAIPSFTLSLTFFFNLLNIKKNKDETVVDVSWKLVSNWKSFILTNNLRGIASFHVQWQVFKKIIPYWNREVDLHPETTNYVVKQLTMQQIVKLKWEAKVESITLFVVLQ